MRLIRIIACSQRCILGRHPLPQDSFDHARGYLRQVARGGRLGLLVETDIMDAPFSIL